MRHSHQYTGKAIFWCFFIELYHDSLRIQIRRTSEITNHILILISQNLQHAFLNLHDVSHIFINHTFSNLCCSLCIMTLSDSQEWTLLYAYLTKLSKIDISNVSPLELCNSVLSSLWVGGSTFSIQLLGKFCLQLSPNPPPTGQQLLWQFTSCP